MTLPEWHLEPIAKSHRRSAFDCGDAELNFFLHRFARQNHEQGASKTYCAVEDADPHRILGFYTIAPMTKEHALLPADLTRGMSKHDVTGYRLARLATDLTVAGHGLGSKLIASAARKCFGAAREVGGMFFFIDAKNERVAEWYKRFGAIPLEAHPLTLVMPLATFEAEFDHRRGD